jgi:hypothetical protein
VEGLVRVNLPFLHVAMRWLHDAPPAEGLARTQVSEGFAEGRVHLG